MSDLKGGYRMGKQIRKKVVAYGGKGHFVHSWSAFSPTADELLASYQPIKEKRRWQTTADTPEPTFECIMSKVRCDCRGCQLERLYYDNGSKRFHHWTLWDMVSHYGLQVEL